MKSLVYLERLVSPKNSHLHSIWIESNDFKRIFFSGLRREAHQYSIVVIHFWFKTSQATSLLSVCRQNVVSEF